MYYIMHVDQVTIHYKSDYVTIHVLSAMHYVLGKYFYNIFKTKNNRAVINQGKVSLQSKFGLIRT